MSTTTVNQGWFPLHLKTCDLTARGSHVSQNLQEALDHIRIASETPAKKECLRVESSLAVISSHAENNGLSQSDLQVLINSITSPNSLDQSSQNIIVKSLYPAGKVTPDLIRTVVGSLGYGGRKSTVSTQQLLLQWINMVSDYLEEPSQLSSFYSVLFNLLDMMSLRTYLCRILAKITRRKHVRPFRVEILQELWRSVEQDAALIALMHVYNKYSSGSFDTVNLRKTLDHPHPDPEWAAQLERIQKGTAYSSTRANARMASSRFLQRSTTITAHTASTIQSHNGPDVFVDQLETIGVSELTVSDLEDPVLQKYITLNLPQKGLDEVDQYLASVLGQQIEKIAKGQKPDRALSTLLQNLHRTIFSPLERAILTTPTTKFTNPQTTLLNFYNTVLTSWTLHLLSNASPHSLHQTTPLLSLLRHTSTLTLTLLTTSPTQTTLSHILTNLETPLPLLHPPHSLPIPPPSPQTIYLLLFSSPSLPTLSRLSSILAIYKAALEGTTAQQQRPRDHIPLLNAALMDTCNLLFRSRAFKTTDAHALGCLLPPRINERLSSYTASLEPPQPLAELFSLSSHSVVAALSIACFREMEEAAEEERTGSVRVRHAGPVTQKSLVQLGREGGVSVDWKGYRVAVLKWLEAMGAKGVRELGGATMKGLLGGQDSVAGARDGTAT